MATKNNPGKYDCYENADPDEPMFILLGRDPDGPRLVDEWANARENRGYNPEKVAEARQCAESMRQWLAKIGRTETAMRAIAEKAAENWLADNQPAPDTVQVPVDTMDDIIDELGWLVGYRKKYSEVETFRVRTEKLIERLRALIAANGGKEGG